MAGPDAGQLPSALRTDSCSGFPTGLCARLSAGRCSPFLTGLSPALRTIAEGGTVACERTGSCSTGAGKKARRIAATAAVTAAPATTGVHAGVLPCICDAITASQYASNTLLISLYVLMRLRHSAQVLTCCSTSVASFSGSSWSSHATSLPEKLHIAFLRQLPDRAIHRVAHG